MGKKFLGAALALGCVSLAAAQRPDPISPAEIAARFDAAGSSPFDAAASRGDWTWVVASFGPRTIVASRAIAMPDGSLTALRFSGDAVTAESYKPYWLKRLACASFRSPFSGARRAPLAADGSFVLAKTPGRGCWDDPGRFYCGGRVACDDGIAGLAGSCRLIAADRLVCRVTLDYDGLGEPLRGYMGFVRGLVGQSGRLIH